MKALHKNNCDPRTQGNALLGVILGGSALLVAAEDEFLQVLAIAGIFLGFVLWLGPFKKVKK